jgi:hypothetical protein
MFSSLLKRWRGNFVTVKRQRDGLRAFKEASSTPPKALLYTSV